MIDTKANHSIIKILGLLREYPDSERKKIQISLCKLGYKNDGGSEETKKNLKDIFYPDFRSLLFIKNHEKNHEEEI
jgi:hypothetical protein